MDEDLLCKREEARCLLRKFRRHCSYENPFETVRSRQFITENMQREALRSLLPLGKVVAPASRPRPPPEALRAWLGSLGDLLNWPNCWASTNRIQKTTAINCGFIG